MGIKCYRCKLPTKKLKGVTRLISGKYLVSGITLYKCKMCGEEYYDGKEYERIRKKIHANGKSSKPVVMPVGITVV